jgi:hypothetical protein
MTSSELKTLIEKLSEVQEPTLPEIRSTTYGAEVDEITLSFAINCSGEDEGEDTLAELNDILAAHDLRAEWTGNGNGDDMDATVSIPVEGARYEPYGFGTSKLVLA